MPKLGPSAQQTQQPNGPANQQTNQFQVPTTAAGWRAVARAVALWACQRSTRPNSSQLMMDVDYDGRCRPTKKNNQEQQPKQSKKMNRSFENRQKSLPAICQEGAAQREKISSQMVKC